VELKLIKEWWYDVTEGPIGWVIYLAIGVGLAILLNVGLSFVLSTDYPVVTVESDSMKPVLYPGDIVFVRSVEEYKSGDIIVFDGWKVTPIIHRIVSISERTEENISVDVWKDFDGITVDELKEIHYDKDDVDFLYVTKGDNNPVCDQCEGTADMVFKEDIHGKKIFRVPYIGWIKLGGVRLVNIFT